MHCSFSVLSKRRSIIVDLGKIPHVLDAQKTGKVILFYDVTANFYNGNKKADQGEV